MRLIAIIVISLISLADVYAQSFEGRVTYKCSYTSKMPGATSEQLTAMMGDQQFYFLGKGTYKVESNGQMLQSQLFAKGENRVYSKLAMSESFYYNDASENPDPAIKVEVKKNVLTVLGYMCDEVVLTTKSGTQRFFFNSKLKVDPAPFANFKFGNWATYLETAKAVPLKMIIQTDRFDSEITATEIKEQSIDESFFSLPAGAKTEKNPF